MNNGEGVGLLKDTKRKGDYMTVFTGGQYYPLDPRPEDVNIIDIAQSLGNQARYGGHCNFYSVAEHSIHVSYMVPQAYALTGLLHDATECYTNDVIRPIKRCLGKDNIFFEIERLNYSAIAKKFSLPDPMPECVHYADNQILVLEKEVLHPRTGPWDLNYPRPEGITLQLYNPEEAGVEFIKRFCDLTGENRNELLEVLWVLRNE